MLLSYYLLDIIYLGNMEDICFFRDTKYLLVIFSAEMNDMFE